MKDVIVYTDGGCHGNPGPGAWAWVSENDDSFIERSGYDAYTTNNRMELSAVIDALQWAQSEHVDSIILHTDSQYVQKGITTWIIGWMRNGWRTANKQEVKNKDLWIQLYELSKKLTIQWKWVKGHAGNLGNERCDALVGQRIRQNQLP